MDLRMQKGKGVNLKERKKRWGRTEKKGRVGGTSCGRGQVPGCLVMGVHKATHKDKIRRPRNIEAKQQGKGCEK